MRSSYITPALILVFGLMGSTATRAFGGAPASSGSWQALAASSLETNIVDLPSGSYLAAGDHQFRSLWTRDFCFSIRGLLALGRADVVRDQLSILLQNLRPDDGLVPKVFDSMSPDWRNVAAFLFYTAGVNANLPLVDPLKPYYVDSNKSEAIDSNILVVLGALDYLEATGDRQWWDENEDALISVFHFYDSKIDPSTGLISQGAYSDWQDSVRREGVTFYTNLLYALALKRLAAFPRFGISSRRWRSMRARLDRVFLDPASGIYRSIQGEPYFSLGANLLAIDRGFFEGEGRRAKALYANLKASPFWSGRGGIPGFVTYPDYPDSWRSGTVSFVGLGHYHDQIYWSWLIAMSAKVALDEGDVSEANRITLKLAHLIERDAGVAEIYSPSSSLPDWWSEFFSAEFPFSWGAATTVELSQFY